MFFIKASREIIQYCDLLELLQIYNRQMESHQPHKTHTKITSELRIKITFKFFRKTFLCDQFRQQIRGCKLSVCVYVYVILSYGYG